MPRKKKKIFVLDTNVILHDHECIMQFEENDVVIPITVLAELDQFKKGNQSINYHARQFVRFLDKLTGDRLFNGGLRIAPDLGKMTICLEQEIHKDLRTSFGPSVPDHLILNSAYNLKQNNPGQPVILVSKDVNLRMKAKSTGLLAQDYRSDKVQDISTLYKGKRRLEPVDSELIDRLFQSPHEFPSERLNPQEPLQANEYLILRSGQKSALAYYNPGSAKIELVPKFNAYGIRPRNAEQSFALAAMMNDQIKLVTLTGKAGTGKTLLSVAAALQQRRHFVQIFLARPVIQLSNREIGYLPGTIDEKLTPYIQPLYDNLGVIKNQFEEQSKEYQLINRMLEDNKLKIEPLSYIRGRSLVKIFFIVDEAQNLTPHEVKTIVSRAGEGTKIILTGDVFQIDHPYLDSQSNGLSYLIERMTGQSLYAHLNLEKGERSELADLASNLL